MFITILLPVVVTDWFGIKSATSALKRQMEFILRPASNGAQARLREFPLRLKEETLPLSAYDRMRKALEIGRRGDSRNVSEVLSSSRERMSREGCATLTVMDGSKLVGLLTVEKIGKLLIKSAVPKEVIVG